MSGSATFTTVMSSSSMKIATDTAISVHHLRSTGASSRVRSSRPSTIGTAAPLFSGRLSALLQVLGQERHDPLPQQRRRARAVHRLVVGEERVAGAVVDVDADGPAAGR